MTCPTCKSSRTKPWGKGWLPNTNLFVCLDCNTRWVRPKEQQPAP